MSAQRMDSLGPHARARSYIDIAQAERGKWNLELLQDKAVSSKIKL